MLSWVVNLFKLSLAFGMKLQEGNIHGGPDADNGIPPKKQTQRNDIVGRLGFGFSLSKYNVFLLIVLFFGTIFVTFEYETILNFKKQDNLNKNEKFHRELRKNSYSSLGEVVLGILSNEKQDNKFNIRGRKKREGGEGEGTSSTSQRYETLINIPLPLRHSSYLDDGSLSSQPYATSRYNIDHYFEAISNLDVENEISSSTNEKKNRNSPVSLSKAEETLKSDSSVSIFVNSKDKTEKYEYEDKSCAYPYQKINPACPRFVYLPIASEGGLGNKYFTLVLGMLLAIELHATYIYDNSHFIEDSYPFVDDLFRWDLHEYTYEQFRGEYEPSIHKYQGESGKDNRNTEDKKLNIDLKEYEKKKRQQQEEQYLKEVKLYEKAVEEYKEEIQSLLSHSSSFSSENSITKESEKKNDQNKDEGSHSLLKPLKVTKIGHIPWENITMYHGLGQNIAFGLGEEDKKHMKYEAHQCNIIYEADDFICDKMVCYYSEFPKIYQRLKNIMRCKMSHSRYNDESFKMHYVENILEKTNIHYETDEKLKPEINTKQNTLVALNEDKRENNNNELYSSWASNFQLERGYYNVAWHISSTHFDKDYYQQVFNTIADILGKDYSKIAFHIFGSNDPNLPDSKPPKGYEFLNEIFLEGNAQNYFYEARTRKKKVVHHDNSISQGINTKENEEGYEYNEKDNGNDKQQFKIVYHNSISLLDTFIHWMSADMLVTSGSSDAFIATNIGYKSIILFEKPKEGLYGLYTDPDYVYIENGKLVSSKTLDEVRAYVRYKYNLFHHETIPFSTLLL